MKLLLDGIDTSMRGYLAFVLRLAVRISIVETGVPRNECKWRNTPKVMYNS